MKLYYLDIREPLPPDWPDIVPPGRRERARKFLREENRLCCLGAGILLARELGVVSDDDLIYAPGGKPKLKNGAAQFNLSHSGNFVLLAVSDRAVGVDIERIAEFDYWQVARHNFTLDEQQWLREENECTAFYRLWTGKEAVLKATGDGFMKDPASFTVLPALDGPHLIDGRIWDMTWFRIENHQCCVAEAEKN